jgi:hypothetical protein
MLAKCHHIMLFSRIIARTHLLDNNIRPPLEIIRFCEAIVVGIKDADVVNVSRIQTKKQDNNNGMPFFSEKIFCCGAVAFVTPLQEFGI